MSTKLALKIVSQPDDLTCGPTCLHAIYSFYNDTVPLDQLIDEVRMLDDGGTLDVFLANHALQRGYPVTIYSYNLHLFDPTWFGLERQEMMVRLQKQTRHKDSAKLATATSGYLRYLELGGELKFADLTAALIRKYLKRNIPIMTGLSATYLYHAAREIPDTMVADDIEGEPTGHFVVLCGYDKKTRQVRVADPYRANPYSADGYYLVDMHRLIGSILLGIATYDANLLIMEPKREQSDA